MAQDAPQEGPQIRRLTRRELLKRLLTAGGIAAGAGAGGVGWWLHSRPDSPPAPVPPGFKKIDLTPRWSVNPAFCAQVLPDRGGVAWTGQENGSVKAYSLNPEGWVVWRLCDGQRSQEQIGSEFAQQTGRPAAEARGFLRDLQRKGLVVQGGYLVASADFPEGPVVREAPEGPEGAEQEREEFR